ncbi:hypothetical protein LLG10_04470 [bacterium]|nr:hypothetical protein [bacterium]
MSFIHRELASGKWRELSFLEQMGNIGSEIDRTIKWKLQQKPDLSSKVFERALELVDLTIQDPKNLKRLRELCRVREALVDYFIYDNQYESNDDLWHQYFYVFAYAAQNRKHLQGFENKPS